MNRSFFAIAVLVGTDPWEGPIAFSLSPDLKKNNLLSHRISELQVPLARRQHCADG